MSKTPRMSLRMAELAPVRAKVRAIEPDKTAQISKILTFSCVDGPGNRLVLFLQGCNFNCKNCHNPHTINHCNHCGDCVSACPTGALTKEDGKINWRPELCTHCDDCLVACPINANPMIHQYHVSDILALLHKHRVFLNGITVTGGEATLQLAFIEALFQAIKADPTLAHLSCMIDSNGHLREEGWQRLLPVLDGAMIDLKGWHNKDHLWLTGQGNQRVLDSIRFLHEHHKLHEVRYLVIPGLTDQPQEIQGAGRFLHQIDAGIRLKLNAFQHHGVRGDALNWPKCTERHIEGVANQFSHLGLKDLIKPAVYL